MENTPGASGSQHSVPPSLSALLADDSYDHIGRPISVEYKKIWITKASANRNKLGRLCQDDLDAIHQVIAPAAMNWEVENGMIYHHDQSPITHQHPGFVGAEIVPIKLNLGEGERIDSFAGDKALRNNDFTAWQPEPMLHSFNPQDFGPEEFERWRIYDKRNRLKKSFPAHYTVWQRPRSGTLYACIPMPLEGLSRAASCDHCQIHDPELAVQTVDYFDDRRQVDGMREVSAVDTAITPFSLCRFHWWYVYSGELLRRSHIHALEILVGGDLFERWGISHMREFLDFMKAHNLTLGEADDKEYNSQPRREEPAPLDETQAAMPCVQQAGSATADGPDGIEAIETTEQELKWPHTGALGGVTIYDLNRFAELVSTLKDPVRRAVFELPARAIRRGALPGRLGPTNDHNQSSITSSASAPGSHNSGALEQVETPQMNGQSTASGEQAPAAGDDTMEQPAIGASSLTASNPVTADVNQQSNGELTSQYNAHAASNLASPAAPPQTNATPARIDGLAYSPPKEPRAIRAWRAARGGNHNEEGQINSVII